MSPATILLAIAVTLFVTPATAAKCKPAPMSCMKGDDWIDGVNKRACRRMHGSWESTYSPLDGDEFCDPKKRRKRSVKRHR